MHLGSWWLRGEANKPPFLHACFSQYERIFLNTISSRLNFCDSWIPNLLGNCLVNALLLLLGKQIGYFFGYL